MLIPIFFRDDDSPLDNSKEGYIFRQFTLITMLVGCVAMLIWGLAPLREHNNKMKLKMEQHRIHDKYR